MVNILSEGKANVVISIGSLLCEGGGLDLLGIFVIFQTIRAREKILGLTYDSCSVTFMSIKISLPICHTRPRIFSFAQVFQMTHKTAQEIG